MNYLVWQLWACLAIALLLGTFLGWFFRGGCKHKLANVTEEWLQRFNFIKEERDVLILKIQDRERLNHENKNLLSRLTAMKNGANLASNVLKENKERLDLVEANLLELKQLLEQRDLEISELKNSLDKAKEEGQKSADELIIMQALLKAYEQGSDDLSKSELGK